MKRSHCFTALTPLTFLERSGLVYRESPAIVTDNKIYTYGEFLGRARQLSTLLKTLSVGEGDCVGVLSDNCEQVIEAHFAVPATLGYLCSFNPSLSTSELKFQIDFCECKVILVSYENFLKHSALFSVALKNIDQKILILGTSQKMDWTNRNVLDYENAIAPMRSDEPLDACVVDEMCPIAINFTSGTTGAPKGVIFSHRAAYIQALGQALIMKLGHESNYLWSLPMFHGNGWFHIWANVAVGAKQFIQPTDHASKVVPLSACVSEKNISHFAGAPRLIRQLFEVQPLKRWENITVMTGGAAPPHSLILNMKRCGARLIHQYGLNETCATFTLCEPQARWDNSDDQEQAKLMSRQGVPAIHAGTGFRVVDEEGTDVANDGLSVGEIIMSGNTVALGYYKNKAATDKSFIDGWFYSGDLAVVHPDGYIAIKDRKKDLIYVDTEFGWLNISSISVERSIGLCPLVKDIAVVGYQSLEGERTEVIAFVELMNDQVGDVEKLKTFCQSTMGVYEVPNKFYVTELPKTATGKVQKHILIQKLKDRIFTEESVGA